MPRPPSILQHVRQVLGRAVRETGQALDRLGLRTAQLAATKHDYYDDPCRFDDYLSRHRQQMPLLWSGKPQVHAQVAYVAPCATMIGSVYVGPRSSIWYGAVLRADECLNAEAFQQKSILSESNSKELDIAVDDDDDETPMKKPWTLTGNDQKDHHHGGAIFIGADTNVQDGCILTSRVGHTVIGKGVTIGHLAQIHSAKVDDYCLIGMGSIIREGAHIETESFVGAGAVVGPGQIIHSGELWVGNPARKLKDLSDKERQRLHYQSSEYVAVATGQSGVMELGGNVADDDLLLEEAVQEEQQQHQEQDALKIQSG